MQHAGDEQLALAYIMWLHFEKPEDFWSVEHVTMLSFSQEWDELWRVTLMLLHEADDDWCIAAIAAGPLEELIGHAGERYIDRIEAESVRNPILSRALTGVWRHGGEIPDGVWSRIQTLVRECRNPIK